MSDRIKAEGWRGLGLWISPQKTGMQRNQPISLDESEPAVSLLLID